MLDELPQSITESTESHVSPKSDIRQLKLQTAHHIIQLFRIFLFLFLQQNIRKIPAIYPLIENQSHAYAFNSTTFEASYYNKFGKEIQYNLQVVGGLDCNAIVRIRPKSNIRT